MKGALKLVFPLPSQALLQSSGGRVWASSPTTGLQEKTSWQRHTLRPSRAFLETGEGGSGAGGSGGSGV